jgi:FkbM family methyltransferase
MADLGGIRTPLHRALRLIAAPWRRRPPLLSRAQAFMVAYGRPPSVGEAHTLAALRPSRVASDAAQLRAVIAGFDRLQLSTPIAVRFGEADLETVDCGDFRLVVDRTDAAVGRAIKHDRRYEPHLTEFVRRMVRPGMIAIDGGANIGFFTMLLARLVGAEGRVLAFEPNSENCRLLLLSRSANGFDQVQLYPFALWDTPEAVCLFPAVGSNGALMPDRQAALKSGNCLVVPSLPLDALAPAEADFLKLDIEGAEYLALKGAEQLLRRSRPVIATEFSLEMLERVSRIAGGDFLRWVAGLGYRPHLVSRETGALEPIDDIDAFLAGWGSPLRVEDLALLPRERAIV